MSRSNHWNEAIYHIISTNKGTKVKAPDSYSWIVNIDIPGSYYKDGQYDFLDEKGNSVKQYDVYSLVTAFPDELLSGYPKVLIHDESEDQWYMFSNVAEDSIRQMIDTAEKNGFLKVISKVVNTHFHGDHVNGNQEFMKSEFISTVWTRDLLSDMGEVNIDLMQQNTQKLITSLNHVRSQERDPHILTEIDYDLSVQRTLYDAIPSLRRVTPTITFEDKLVIQGTKRTIEVLSYGGGHSLSDAVVYVPGEQTLIAGDLISTKTIPVMPYGNPYAWIRILKRIQKDLKVNTIVPGHGDVSNSDRITDVIRFLEETIAYVSKAVTSGKSESYWLEQGVLKGYEDWHLPQYFRWNFRWLFNSMLVQNNR
ncbi:MBL fold metallo-hydrolase [Paenibacillus sp. GM2]|uniref:MBL fold metallo-hydrolase n=1 Tax=Paenibacillus sp. GM2 TaxID=1622070 RepID=UPI000837B6E4|nr:MBL fold metallo-hydrolase [Paenibacillus sp. GM2]